MWYVWLILAGVFLIFEIFTAGFLIFWLSLGALVAMIISFFISNIVIQTTIFVISSTIFILATKPLVNKIALRNENSTKTNAYSLVGKTGVVTKEIDSINSTGQIKVEGEIWSALCEDVNIVPVGTKVRVLSIKGVKAEVEII